MTPLSRVKQFRLHDQVKVMPKLGHVTRFYDVNTVEDCVSACTTNAECVVFTYGTRNLKCFLLDGIANATSYNNWISGIHASKVMLTIHKCIMYI